VVVELNKSQLIISGGLHLKFLKRLLNVNQSTCNAFVYGELGRYPLYVRIVKYWLKIQSSDNIILKYVYMYLLKLKRY